MILMILLVRRLTERGRWKYMTKLLLIMDIFFGGVWSWIQHFYQINSHSNLNSQKLIGVMKKWLCHRPIMDKQLLFARISSERFALPEYLEITMAVLLKDLSVQR